MLGSSLISMLVCSPPSSFAAWAMVVILSTQRMDLLQHIHKKINAKLMGKKMNVLIDTYSMYSVVVALRIVVSDQFRVRDNAQHIGISFDRS